MPTATGGQALLFPRPNGRGLIEARLAGERSPLGTAHFRDLTVAA